MAACTCCQELTACANRQVIQRFEFRSTSGCMAGGSECSSGAKLGELAALKMQSLQLHTLVKSS